MLLRSTLLRSATGLLIAAYAGTLSAEPKPGATAQTTDQVIPHHQSSVPGPALSPEEAIRRMTMPEGFSIELVASEPDLVNPVAMAIDERGRFWVTESIEYPRRSPGKGQDRIKVLEDTDHDGKVDKVTVFADGLNIPSGIAVGYGGVWVANAPDLLYLRDTDGDGRADESRIIVTGFGRHDTHELPNSLTWGPDGYLYGLNGVFNPSVIAHRGAEHRFTCAMFRINPTPSLDGPWKGTHDFALFAQGTSNPWGIAHDDRGNAFVSACVIDHLWHLAETGYYHRQGGPYPPHTWKLGSIVQHRHQMAAYCGLAWFDSDAYPEPFRRRLYMGNIHGGCINSDSLTPVGASYRAKPNPDLLTANDPWFMPVALKTGPDGCLYILDWYDRYHCYQDANRDPAGIDRLRGRLYRLRHRDSPRPSSLDLASESDAQLVHRLASPNVFLRETAQRLLQERLRDQGHEPAARALHALFTDAAQPRGLRLHALWSYAGGNRLDEPVALSLMAQADPLLRAWGVRLLGDAPRLRSETLRRRVSELAREPEPEVLLQVVVAAGKGASLDAHEAWLDVLERAGGDAVLPAIVWQNLHPTLEPDPSPFLGALARRGPEFMRSRGYAELAPRLVDRVLALPAPSHAAVSGLLRALAPLPDRRVLAQSLARVQEYAASGQMRGDRGAAVRRELMPVLEPLASLDDDAGLAATLLLASWSHAPSLRAARGLAQQPGASEARRVRAMQALAEADDEGLPALVETAFAGERRLSTDGAREALAALARSRRPEIGRALRAALPALPAELRPQAVNLLASRGDWAAMLLEAVESKTILPDQLDLNQVRTLTGHPEASVAQRARAIWGLVRAERSPERERVVREVRALLQTTPGNAADGRKVFDRLCAQCHKLHGQGQELGPDLTSNGRGSLEQLLSNVLDPNLVIGPGYQPRVVSTLQGDQFTGLLLEETPTRLVLALPNGVRQTVARDELARNEISPLSLMPEGLEKGLSRREIADLFTLLALERSPEDPAVKWIPGAGPVDLKKLRVPPGLSNLLLSATVESNVGAQGDGRKGNADHPLWDPVKGRFLRDSQWHEDGVRHGLDLGVLPEDRALAWTAKWAKAVEVNFLCLSGAYPNQPQPHTAWKIELREVKEGAGSEPSWVELERGVGGWYDSGRYLWGGPGAPSRRIDGLRVSVFSKDEKTAVRSPHFRGEPGWSWVMGLAPADAAFGE